MPVSMGVHEAAPPRTTATKLRANSRSPPKWAAPPAARSVALNGAWWRMRCSSPVNQSNRTVPW